MKSIYEKLVAAIGAHWKAHDNKYPQQIVLSTSQHADLIKLRELGRGGAAPLDPGHFLGVPIKVDDSAPAEMIATDGTHTPLA